MLPTIGLSGVNDVNQTEIPTAEPLVTDPSAFQFGLVMEKLWSHKSPSTDQISKDLIKADCRKFRYEIHKLIISIWNKEKLLEEWKKSNILLIYEKCDKSDCSNYKGISVLPTTYNTLSNILITSLPPYVEEIIVDL